jgi:polyisoprenoid-binding protein YceI
MKRFLSAVLAIVLATSSLSAQYQITLDKAHSIVQFTAQHLVISSVTGSFTDFDVSFAGTKPDYTDANLAATIKVASINTNNERRDAHLKSPDFFDANKYPEITFKSTSFTKTGENTYAIAGNLTMKGVTRPIVFNAIYKGETSAWGKTIVVFTASGEVNRFDFGLQWDKTIESGNLIVGEKVKFDLTFEGTK